MASRKISRLQAEIDGLVEQISSEEELEFVRQFVGQRLMWASIERNAQNILRCSTPKEIFKILVDAVILGSEQVGQRIDGSSVVVFDKNVGRIVHSTYTGVENLQPLSIEDASIKELIERKREGVTPYLVETDIKSPSFREKFPSEFRALYENNLPRIRSIAVFPVFVEDNLVATLGIDYHKRMFSLEKNSVLLGFCYTLTNFAGLALELLRRNQKLIASESMAFFGDIAGNVVHTMNSRLITIGAFAQQLKLEKGINDKNKIADEIVGDIEGALEYTRGMRSLMASLEGGKFDAYRVNLLEVVDKLREFVESRTIPSQRVIHDNINFTVLYNIDKMLLVPLPLLFDVLNTLVENGIESVADQGSGEVILEITDRGSSVDIKISDNGPGIPIDARNKLFTFGYTTKVKHGMGWGLAWVKRYLMRYGIEIYIGYEPLTTFSFTVPVSDK